MNLPESAALPAQKTNISLSMPSILLRLEGLAVLAAAITLYAMNHFNGWVFVTLLFVPDVSLLLMAVNARLGSIVYNIVHYYGIPVALGALALAAGWTPGLQIALIWFAHIGMDRTIGYGFKYVGQFKETHLSRV